MSSSTSSSSSPPQWHEHNATLSCDVLTLSAYVECYMVWLKTPMFLRHHHSMTRTHRTRYTVLMHTVSNIICNISRTTLCYDTTHYLSLLHLFAPSLCKGCDIIRLWFEMPWHLHCYHTTEYTLSTRYCVPCITYPLRYIPYTMQIFHISVDQIQCTIYSISDTSCTIDSAWSTTHTHTIPYAMLYTTRNEPYTVHHTHTWHITKYRPCTNYCVYTVHSMYGNHNPYIIWHISYRVLHSTYYAVYSPHMLHRTLSYTVYIVWYTACSMLCTAYST